MPPMAGLALFLVAALGACQSADEPAENATVVETASNCEQASFLSAELYGSIERSLGWTAADMRCESMLRPDGQGVRLRFEGTAADRQLAIILALPDLERGRTAKELATITTLTVEGSGRFFSTPNLDSCWTDITAQDAAADGGNLYDITGTLYCVAPLGEVNGEAAVSIPELRFRSTIDWGDE